MSNGKKYNFDYFINKFEAIPEENWYVGEYVNPNNEVQMCALGHCGDHLNSNDYNSDSEANKLCNIAPGVVTVNDGESPDYKQLSPKQRVLAYLKDLKTQDEALYE